MQRNIIKTLYFRLVLCGMVLFGLPLVSFAAELSTIKSIFDFFTSLISNSIIPILLTLALVVFFLGVVRMMGSADDPKKREEGRKFMLWGVIGLFVIVSLWGIISVLTNTFGLGDAVIPQLP